MITNGSKTAALLLLLIVISEFRCDSAAAQDSSELIKLAAYDNVFLSGYKIVLLVSQPSIVNAKMGFTTSTMTLSGDGQRQSLRQDAMAADPVKYSSTKLHIYGQRDPKGNFVVGLPKSLSIYLDGEGGKIRHDEEVRTIPKDKLLPASRVDANTRIESFASSDQDLLNQYYRYILPLGRGFSQLIDSIVGVEANGDGTEKIKARGRLFSRYVGEWTLQVDTLNDYVVTSATFKQDAARDLDFKMNGIGLAGADLKLNQSGWVDFKGYRIGVELIDYKALTDSQFINKMNAMANDTSTYSDRATIVDFHQIDGQGMPQIRKIERDVRRADQ